MKDLEYYLYQNNQVVSKLLVDIKWQDQVLIPIFVLNLYNITNKFWYYKINKKFIDIYIKDVNVINKWNSMEISINITFQNKNYRQLFRIKVDDFVKNLLKNKEKLKNFLERINNNYNSIFWYFLIYDKTNDSFINIFYKNPLIWNYVVHWQFIFYNI